MNYEQAYQWLHGDRTEYSGCREAAEAMEAEVQALRKDAERYRLLRVLMAVEDVARLVDEYMWWSSCKPDPTESAKTDDAVDGAMKVVAKAIGSDE